MARSPSPRRDSRDYRRYSRSPDRRRRSRSPRERRRSPRRNSPDYRPYRKEEREPYRNHHRPRSPRADRGGRRRRDDDISDDDIKADSLQDLYVDFPFIFFPPPRNTVIPLSRTLQHTHTQIPAMQSTIETHQNDGAWI